MRDHKWIDKPLRITDSAAIQTARLEHCEHCGNPRGPFHVHHVRSKGSGGHDCHDNLINLCWLCHHKAHEGRIPRSDLLEIVAARESLKLHHGWPLLCPECRDGSALVWSMQHKHHLCECCGRAA